MAAAQHAFVLAGLQGTGKSTVASMITDSMSVATAANTVTSTEVSDFVRALFEADSDEVVNDNELGRWAANQKAAKGNDYFVRAMAELWHGDDNPHVVISGVRSPAEANAVRDVFGAEHTTVIALWTLPDLRFERKYDAVPSDDHPKWETFHERDERELHEWNCVEFFCDDDLSDYVLNNNRALDGVRDDIEHIIDHEVYNRGKRIGDHQFPSDDPEVVAQYL
jgi:dephospho-CoA kinase